MEKIDFEKQYLPETECNVCSWTDRNCLNCSYFDPNYHGGYCDLHRSDTSPTKSCSSWIEG